MRIRLAPQKVMAATGRDEPARFCFRYRGGRRHRRLYDVVITLGDTGAGCHIEVYHALPVSDDDPPPFASGHLDAARLMRAVDLLGLVKRVTSHDHAAWQPGRLVFDAHLHIPWRPVAAAPDARTRPSRPSSAARHALVPFGAPRAARIAPVEKSPVATHARVRTRYPLHGLWHGAGTKRHGKTV